MMSESQAIRPGQLLAYGLPALGLQATSLVASLYLLKFASVELAIAPAAVGAVLALSRAWDAISDPLVGHASDRTRARFGRRRLWMLVGAPVVGLAFTALWAPNHDLSVGLRTAWLTCAIFTFYTGYTCVSVPQWSLGAELSRRPRERNRLYAARGALQNAGLFVALVSVYFLENADSTSLDTTQIGAIVGVVSGASIVLGTIAVREPRGARGWEAESRAPSVRLASALRGVVANEPARLLIAIVGLQELATAALLVVLPFATEHLVDAPGQTALYLVAFVIPMTLSLPVWVRVGDRVDPMRAWRVGFLIAGCGFLMVASAGAGDQPWLAFCAALIGIGHGASRVYAMSALARIADEDERRTGQAKTGMFFAASAFTEKCAVALASFVVGVALQASGFVAGDEPGFETRLVLRGASSVVPAVLMAATWLMLGSSLLGSDSREDDPDVGRLVSRV